ncbi:fibronectin type III domain-containing protein [Neobacillus massiliamazoniensis]|uniref:Glycerophosphoryl diester phosphodiesterase n=1 Tax=Neobacillus massiliamazoniensis TaxID=1499688 RepID=A0A0U1NQI2_9BACI|nr:fibronectin type III domain-containing protein [Neobacillus massiliamazoniensis]CRK80300.1 glycerophosphoryl diester phosphodiesterase [Neobacillus massiliamazoniensis]
MGKYRVFGSLFDRIFRNDLNANFDDIDKDITDIMKRLTALEQGGNVVPVVPADVTGLAVSNLSFTTLTLTWSASMGATSYDIYKNGVLLTNVSAPTFNVTSLTSNTLYTFKVVAKNSVGSAPGTGSGASISTTTLGSSQAAPNPVTNLQVGTVTSNSISVTWTAPSGGTAVANYEVAYSSDGGSTYTVASSAVNPGSTSYTVNGLNPSKAYIVRVVALDASSNRSSAVTVNATTSSIGLPNDVTNLNVTNITQTSLTLNWTASNGTSYDIYKDGVKIGNTTQTSYNVTGLSSGIQYTFKVKAINASGESAGVTVTARTTGNITIADMKLPFVVAHGGGERIYPEHTLYAYQNVFNDGCKYIEQDVQILGDGTVACIHDNTVDVVTTGSGPVTSFNETTFRQLIFDNNKFFPTAPGYPVVNMSTLEDVFKTFNASILYVIEIKSNSDVDNILALANKYQLQDNIVWQTMVPTAMEYAIQKGAKMTMVGCDPGTLDLNYLKSIGVKYTGYNTNQLTDELIGQMKSMGFGVATFTLNGNLPKSQTDRQAWKGWLDRGVDFTFSDEPVYLSGNDSHVKLKDTFDTQRWYHGMIPFYYDKSPTVPYYRGKFSGGNKWGLRTVDYLGTMFVHQGWGSPVQAGNYKIKFDLTYPAAPPSDTGAWGTIVFESPIDNFNNVNPTSFGYQCALRWNGQLMLWLKNGTSTTVLGSVSTPQMVAGQKATIEIEVTPTAIYARRLDTTPTYETTANDVTHRGSHYFFFGSYEIDADFSNATITHTDAVIPIDVTGLNSTKVQATGLTLNWTKSANAGSYDVYQDGAKIGSTTESIFYVRGLKPSTNYNFKVIAKNSKGSSAGSGSGANGTLSTSPKEVANPLANGIGSTTLTLKWDASTGATSYDVYNGSTLLGNVTSPTYNVTGLTANTSYKFYIYSKNAAGKSFGVPVTVTTTS